MDFRLISFKFLGNLKGNSWASAFESGEDKLLLPRGKIWSVFSAKLNDSSFDKIALSREIFSRFYNSYYSNKTASNFYALRTAVSETFSFYKDKFLNFEMGSVSYSQKEKIVNVAVINGSWAGIVRNSSFSKILEGKESVIAASGYPLPNDMFVFGTKSTFLSFSSFEPYRFVLGGSLNKNELDLFAKEILNQKGNERSALFLIGFFVQKKGFLLAKSGLKKESVISRPNQRFSLSLNKSRLRQKSFLFLKALASVFSKRRENKRVFVRSTFKTLDERDIGKRKVVVSILLVFFILSFSLFGNYWKKKREKDNFLTSKLNEALQKAEDAKNVFATDYQSSRELLWSAKDILSFLEDNKYKSKRILELKEKIKEQEERVLKEYYVSPSVFVDLTLLSADFKIDKLISDESLIVVFDRVGKRVAKVSFENKKTETVAGPSDFEEYQDIALYANNVFVLTKKGFFNVKESSKMLFRNDFGENSLIYYYAGNVYVLDKDASRIYRINSSNGDFSLPQIWTASDLNLNFKEARGWFIDGFIWVLFSDGKILKFSKGVPERIVLKNVFPKLENIQSIYSNEEASFLYVLDSVVGRVVVFGKSGNYVAQYFSDEIKGAKNLVVSEKEKRMVFSKEGGKLYLIEMKHL